MQDSFLPPLEEEAAAAKTDVSSPDVTYEEAKRSLAFDVTIDRGSEPQFLEEKQAKFEVRQPASAPAPQPPAEDVFAENKRFLHEQTARMRQERVDPACLEYKGELFRTYLIYEEGDNAYFIDQHAAHERILYDRLCTAMEEGGVRSQPMLVPFMLSLNAQEFAFLEKNFSALRAMGFEIEEFGDDSIRVAAVPLPLTDIDLSAFFGDVLSSMETLRAIRLADLMKEKLATAACKAAVKGGERLSAEEVRALVAQMDGDTGMKCPHGRPAVVKMKKSEFEKLFKRIV